MISAGKALSAGLGTPPWLCALDMVAKGTLTTGDPLKTLGRLTRMSVGGPLPVLRQVVAKVASKKQNQKGEKLNSTRIYQQRANLLAKRAAQTCAKKV